MASPNLDLPPVPIKDRPEETVSPGRGPRLPKDALLGRLGWACLASALINGFLWWHAAGFVRGHVVPPPQPIEIQRIVLPKLSPPKPKPPKPKPPKPKPPKPKPPKKIVKPIIKPKPIVKPKLVKPRPVVKPRPTLRPKPIPPPPPAAHHHVMVSKGPAAHTALSGGHAPLGKPTEHQNDGEGRNNTAPPPPEPVPPIPPKPEPPPPPKPEPPKPEPPTPPKPEPPAPPKPVGPTQAATFDPGLSPEIPDELKSESFKSFVRVRVVVHPNGSFTPVLLTSSGNADIDRLVLDSLKRRGKAKPALQNGVPIESAFPFRYEIEVQ